MTNIIKSPMTGQPIVGDAIKKTLGVEIEEKNGAISHVMGGVIETHDETVRVGGSSYQTTVIDRASLNAWQADKSESPSNFALSGAAKWFNDGAVKSARDLLGLPSQDLANYLDALNSFQNADGPGSDVLAAQALAAAEKGGFLDKVDESVFPAAHRFAEEYLSQSLEELKNEDPNGQKNFLSAFETLALTTNEKGGQKLDINVGEGTKAVHLTSLDEACLYAQGQILGHQPKENAETALAFAQKLADKTGAEVALAKNVQKHMDNPSATVAPR